MQEPNGVPDSNSFLELSIKCLRQKDFSGCRKHAIQAQQSQIPGADQMLAVADVLQAGALRLRNNHLNWYAILQLTQTESANHQLVMTRFEMLLTQVSFLKRKYDFAQEASKLLCNALSVLSNSEKRTQYEMEIGNFPEKNRENGNGGKETFWTLCPYCYGMFEYEKRYEDFCLRCKVCEKPFHGVSINPPKQEMIVPRKEQYYLCFGAFRVGYRSPVEEKIEVNENCKKMGEFAEGCLDSDVVVISDDDQEVSLDLGGSEKERKSSSSSIPLQNDDNGEFGRMLKEESGGIRRDGISRGEIEKTEMKIEGKQLKKHLKAKARRMKNVKSVHLNSKKIGNRRRNEELTEQLVGSLMEVEGEVSGENVEKGEGIDEEEGTKLGAADDCGLVFSVEDDDIFIGLEDLPL
ncbi:hypothetical protein UlMin_038782 [Ulmus minor]